MAVAGCTIQILEGEMVDEQSVPEVGRPYLVMSKLDEESRWC